MFDVAWRGGISLSKVVRVVLVLVVASCGTASSDPKMPEASDGMNMSVPPDSDRDSDESPALPSWVLATVAGAEPLFAFEQGPAGGMLFYQAEDQWLARSVDARGEPTSPEPVAVAPAPPASTRVALSATKSGFLAVWDEVIDRNHAVRSLILDADGHASGPPSLVVQISDDVSWLGMLPASLSSSTTLLLWEITHDHQSDVFAIPVSATDGRPAGKAQPLVRGALGWDIRAKNGGAVLAAVMPDKTATGRDHLEQGRVMVSSVDAMGRMGIATPASADATAMSDVAVVGLGGQTLVAWTDRSRLDTEVHMAALRDGKIVVAERAVLPPLGDQALVGLSAHRDASGKRALLTWEEVLHRPRSGRLIQMATVFPDLVVSPERAELAFASAGTPYFEPDGEGFAALTLAPAALQDGYEIDLGRGGDGPPLLPAFVRFDANLVVRATQPVLADAFINNHGSPELAHLLRCGEGHCLTVATSASRPTAIATVALPLDASPWLSPAWPRESSQNPSALRLVSVMDGERLADVDAVALSDGKTSLAAWVTFNITVGPSKKNEKEATLGLRTVAANGTLGAPVVLSDRVLSVGGVGLAQNRSKKGDVLGVAYVGRRKGVPQVMMTTVDRTGEQLRHKVITTPKRKTSGASDVAVAASGDGWIVAWVDTRDDNGEVYIARLDRRLTKVVRDTRITEAAGNAAEVRLLVSGDHTYVTWSDDRRKVDGGGSDIYLARLDTASLEKQATEVRLFASSGHSRSPDIVEFGDGVMVAWVEEALLDPRAGKAASNAPATGMLLAELDADGHLVGSPKVVTPKDGSISAMAIDCTHRSGECRALVTVSTPNALDLAGFQWTVATGASEIEPLFNLTGGPNAIVVPTFAQAGAGTALFADDTPGGTGRIRWMQLDWK